VGTTEKVGSDVVYSPTRGRHPNLASEMRSFVKCVGGRNPATVSMAQEYLKKCGFQTLTSDNPASLEFFKLISNVHMGLEIAWRQEVERMIQKFGLDPVEYEAWETTYRDGYLRLKDHNLIRSVMKPDPIGGHCILPCTEILSAQFDSPVLKFILDSNEKRKAELA
jgi:UDP-N-acetyl-D-mannosaminuronate dehydrogenase